MSANKPAGEDKKATTMVADDPHAPRGALKHIGGSQSDNWNDILAQQTIQTLWLAHSDDETRGRQFNATITALIAIGPNAGSAGGRMTPSKSPPGRLPLSGS